MINSGHFLQAINTPPSSEKKNRIEREGYIEIICLHRPTQIGVSRDGDICRILTENECIPIPEKICYITN